MKDLKISDELISEILGKKVSMWGCDSIGGSVIEIGIHLPSGGRLYKQLNIYELAYKCKEWALSKGYIINSGVTTSNDWCCTIYKIIKENPYIKELSHTWEQSEPEAIFLACEYILNNIKQF